MSETIQLVILDRKSLPQGYKALEEMGEMGLEPLEFYPHAQGVRLLFKAPDGFSKSLPKDSVLVQASTKILKAILSQTGNVLKNHLVVIETTNFPELLNIAIELEKFEADILELRSLRSNPEKNYGLFTLDNKDQIEKIISKYDHAFLSATSVTLKEFLGFE